MITDYTDNTLTFGSLGLSVAFTWSIDVIFGLITSVLSAVLVFISIGFKIYKWHKESKADGVITKEEMEKLKEIGCESVSDLIDVIKDIKEHLPDDNNK
jgi:hypothetical protein